MYFSLLYYCVNNLFELYLKYGQEQWSNEDLPTGSEDIIYEFHDYLWMLNTILEYQLSKAAPGKVERLHLENEAMRELISSDHRVFVEDIGLKKSLHQNRKEHFEKIKEQGSKCNKRDAQFEMLRYDMNRNFV